MKNDIEVFSIFSASSSMENIEEDAPTYPHNSVFIQNSYPPPTDLPPPSTLTHSHTFFVQENTPNHLHPPPLSTPIDHPHMFLFQNNNFPEPTPNHSFLFSNQENAPCLPPPPGFPQGMCYLHSASIPTSNYVNYFCPPEFNNPTSSSLTWLELENNIHPVQNGGWQKNAATYQVPIYSSNIPLPNSYFMERNGDEMRELMAMADNIMVDDAPTTTMSFASTSGRGQSHISHNKKVNSSSSKNVAWSLDEHYMYLEGVKKFGHGKWKQISEMMGNVKTPAQIASHAQKHNIRKNTPHVLRKRRTIHDIDELNCTPHNPSQKFPESVESPCESAEKVTKKSRICDAHLGVPSPTSLESLNSAAAVDSSSGEGGDDKTKGLIPEMVPDSSSCPPSIDDMGFDLTVMSSNFLYLCGFKAENYDTADAVRMRNWWETLFAKGNIEILLQSMSEEIRRILECWASLPSLSFAEDD